MYHRHKRLDLIHVEFDKYIGSALLYIWSIQSLTIVIFISDLYMNDPTFLNAYMCTKAYKNVHLTEVPKVSHT
jgi:hypothetical protein